MRKIISLLIVAMCLVLTACEGMSINENLEDGYQVGDVTAGMAENVARYCSAEYKAARESGRLIAGLSGVRIPDLCNTIWAALYKDDVDNNVLDPPSN